MSDIQEEQKRLYKKAEENDIKELIKRNEEIYNGFLATNKELCDTATELDKLQNRINKAIEYIEERFDYVLKDESFLDHDDLVERRIALYLLNILKGNNK